MVVTVLRFDPAVSRPFCISSGSRWSTITTLPKLITKLVEKHLTCYCNSIAFVIHLRSTETVHLETR